ncbi:hypothetical protein [Pandoraea sputorum]|uniref:hypothetical protein n=1 Tax=Pandoraea sputorum TaxID=93222 RepID=UPI00123EE06E|nr:hypothetical protein [Pandoraea sputorum]VVE82654.1 hypothetical protein PSP31120_03706 [Pandoraea sputorum]
MDKLELQANQIANELVIAGIVQVLQNYIPDVRDMLTSSFRTALETPLADMTDEEETLRKKAIEIAIDLVEGSPSTPTLRLVSSRTLPNESRD